MRGTRAFCFSALFFASSCAYADGAWYREDLQRVTTENNCQLALYPSGGEPGHFLLTPEYLVTWCERLPDKKPGRIVCLDPTTQADPNAEEGQLQVLACNREEEETSREQPSYDLIVLTSLNGHEWQVCPKFVDLDLYRTHPLWIEKNPKPYGQTFSLSQFWIAKSLIEETEYVVSDAPANGHALLYGDFDAGQILYCYQDQWVMSGYH